MQPGLTAHCRQRARCSSQVGRPCRAMPWRNAGNTQQEAWLGDQHCRCEVQQPTTFWSTPQHGQGLLPHRHPHLAVLSVLNSTRSVPRGMFRDPNTAAAAGSSAVLNHKVYTLCTFAPYISGQMHAPVCGCFPAKRFALLVQSRMMSGSAFRHTSPVMLLSCGVSTTRAGPAA